MTNPEVLPGFNYLIVYTKDGRSFLVPFRAEYPPALDSIGELPPEVAAEYEVKIVPCPFLVRKVT
jgi:hypothetical protein